MKNNEMTIIVVSTDAYSDLWPSFFECKHRFWKQCRYDTILVTNELVPNFPDVKVIACGKEAQWSDRTREALMHVHTRYVCFLLEDFFISKQINEEYIEKALLLMRESGIKYYKLLSLTKFTGKQYQSNVDIQEITSKYPYGISLMPAIWDKDFFLEKIGNGSYNPWAFEIDRLKEEKNTETDQIIGVFDNRNILNITHMVVQGRFLPTSYRKMKKLGVKQIALSNRSVMGLHSFSLYQIKMGLGVFMRTHAWFRFLLYPFKRFSVAEKYK